MKGIRKFKEYNYIKGSLQELNQSDRIEFGFCSKKEAYLYGVHTELVSPVILENPID